jgi:hypothetical protein
VATNVALDKLTVVNGGVKLPDSGTGPFMTISNAIALAVTPGKTIETADPDALETEVAKVVAEYTQQLIASMNEGCSTTQAFLVGLEQKKVAAFNSMNKKFEEVQSYNNVKVEGIKAVLQGAIMIKFASTVVVKTGTKFLPPVVGFAIELGYDVLVETAKGIGGDSKASLMRVINEDAIEEYSENELKAGTKKVAGKVYGDVENLSKELSKLERQKMERRLSSKKLRNIDRRISRVKGSVDKAASKAKWAGRAVGWAFWADDMNDAWEELQRDLDAAK